MLTTMIDASKESANDFLLPTPSDGDSSAITVKVFLFSTPKCITVYIYKKSLVQDLIRHILTLYSKDPLLSLDMPLLNPEYPEAYELRLIDDDEEQEYKPMYDMPPIDRRD